ncbi:MAG: fibrobacter succinogenes major paralogous domain-containing protein [Ignavibacteriae bacterium]|nr:fibrobacter succinogenes major paralogous domain-containing protein [Ignavibacteriota bacterium]
MIKPSVYGNARPYLENFLTLHQPCSEDGLSGIKKPIYKEEDFKKFMNDLKLRGYGLLKPEVIKAKLHKLTDNWDLRKHRLQASEQIKIKEELKYKDTETIIIGTQEWTSENLNVENYRNGDIIPQVKEADKWAELTTGAWCYYDNNAENGKTYGKLYNWFAVNDPRGLAPAGWHIPSDAEWTQLTDYLDGEGTAGGKLKATKLWDSPNDGATNGSGFNAFPCGIRSYNGDYYGIGKHGFFWSATENNSSFNVWMDYSFNVWIRNLFFGQSVVRRYDGSFKEHGFSIRCVRD